MVTPYCVAHLLAMIVTKQCAVINSTIVSLLFSYRTKNRDTGMTMIKLAANMLANARHAENPLTSPTHFSEMINAQIPMTVSINARPNASKGFSSIVGVNDMNISLPNRAYSGIQSRIPQMIGIVDQAIADLMASDEALPPNLLLVQ